MTKNKFLPEFTAKFSIFAVILKTIIWVKRKLRNTESSSSKTYIETEFNKMQKKFLAEFPDKFGIFAVIR